MKTEKCNIVYCCCGQYIAPTKAVSNKNIYCDRCGKLQTKPVKFPCITIVKS